MNKALLAILGLHAGILVLYFQRYPIFSASYSADFAQHVQMSASLAQGIIPPMSSMLLYYGVEFYLAGWTLLSGVPAIIVDRYAMGVLVLASTVLVYYLALELSEKKGTALLTALLYVLGGTVTEMVFNAGLYAQFYGVVASMLLLLSTLRLLRPGPPGILSLVFFFASVVNFAFSHYSALTIFPPLFVLLGYKMVVNKEKSTLASFLFMFFCGLIGLGAALFSGMLPVLAGYLQGAGPISPPSVTTLGKVLVLPSAAYLVSVVDGPLTGDLAGFVYLALAAFFVLRVKRTWKTAFLSVWLISTLVLAPLNESSWRFAVSATLPLLLIDGAALSRLGYMVRRKFFTLWAWKGRWPFFEGVLKPGKVGSGTVCVFLIALVLVPGVFASSWGFSSAMVSMQADSPQYAATDYSVYQALGWIKAQPTICGTVTGDGPNAGDPLHCSYATFQDWRFSFSPKIGGPIVASINPAPIPTPVTVQTAMANQKAQYFIATNLTLGGKLPYCAHLQILTIEAANSTSGNSLRVKVSTQPLLNPRDGALRLTIDSMNFGAFAVINGSATLTLGQMPRGLHTLRIAYGFEAGNELTVNMGTNDEPIDHPLDPNACDPFGWFPDDFGPTTQLQYQNQDVKIFCVQESCLK